MTYTPMPNQLEPQLNAIVREIGDTKTDASDTVWTIRENLAQAYAAGHREGYMQASSQQYVIKNLKEAQTSRQDEARKCQDA